MEAVVGGQVCSECHSGCLLPVGCCECCVFVFVV